MPGPLAAHPVSTTNRQLTPEEQVAAGVTTETIRPCSGIKRIDDIIEDIEQALAAAR